MSLKVTSALLGGAIDVKSRFQSKLICNSDEGSCMYVDQNAVLTLLEPNAPLPHNDSIDIKTTLENGILEKNEEVVKLSLEFHIESEDILCFMAVKGCVEASSPTASGVASLPTSPSVISSISASSRSSSVSSVSSASSSSVDLKLLKADLTRSGRSHKDLLQDPGFSQHYSTRVIRSGFTWKLQEFTYCPSRLGMFKRGKRIFEVATGLGSEKERIRFELRIPGDASFSAEKSHIFLVHPAQNFRILVFSQWTDHDHIPRPLGSIFSINSFQRLRLHSAMYGPGVSCKNVVAPIAQSFIHRVSIPSPFDGSKYILEYLQVPARFKAIHFLADTKRFALMKKQSRLTIQYVVQPTMAEQHQGPPPPASPSHISNNNNNNNDARMSENVTLIHERHVEIGEKQGLLLIAPYMISSTPTSEDSTAHNVSASASSSSPIVSRIRVLEARYGTPRRWIAVTDVVRRLFLSPDSLELCIPEGIPKTNFFSDPDRMAHSAKMLYVQFEVLGYPFHYYLSEKDGLLVRCELNAIPTASPVRRASAIFTPRSSISSTQSSSERDGENYTASSHRRHSSVSDILPNLFTGLFHHHHHHPEATSSASSDEQEQQEAQGTSAEEEEEAHSDSASLGSDLATPISALSVDELSVYSYPGFISSNSNSLAAAATASSSLPHSASESYLPRFIQETPALLTSPVALPTASPVPIPAPRVQSAQPANISSQRHSLQQPLVPVSSSASPAANNNVNSGEILPSGSMISFTFDRARPPVQSDGNALNRRSFGFLNSRSASQLSAASSVMSTVSSASNLAQQAANLDENNGSQSIIQRGNLRIGTVSRPEANSAQAQAPPPPPPTWLESIWLSMFALLFIALITNPRLYETLHLSVLLLRSLFELALFALMYAAIGFLILLVATIVRYRKRIRSFDPRETFDTLFTKVDKIKNDVDFLWNRSRVARVLFGRRRH